MSSSNLRTQMSNYASCERFCLMFTTQARRKIKKMRGWGVSSIGNHILKKDFASISAKV